MLSEESAKVELGKLYEHYDFDVEDFEDGDEKKVKDALEKIIIKGLKSERLSFKEEDSGFLIVQRLKKSDVEITYKEMTGKAKVIMGKQEKADSHTKCYALLGYLSGEGQSFIEKLKSADLKLAEGIGSLLLIL